MPAKNTTQVLIAGKIVTLSGYESEEYLQKVAAYLNGKIAELSELPGYNRQPMDTMLSLNVADDYFKARRQAESLEEDMQLKDKETYNLKHDLIAAQIELENVKKELESLKSSKEELSEKYAKLEQELDDLLK